MEESAHLKLLKEHALRFNDVEEHIALLGSGQMDVLHCGAHYVYFRVDVVSAGLDLVNVVDHHCEEIGVDERPDQRDEHSHAHLNTRHRACVA